MKKLFTLIVAVMLFGALGFAAQNDTSAKSSKPAKTEKAPKAKAPKTKVATGTIKSASDTELVVTEKSGDVTYKLGADTKKEGDMAAGNHVTVHYTTEGADNMATMVKAKAAKAPKASKPKKGAESGAAPQSK